MEEKAMLCHTTAAAALSQLQNSPPPNASLL